MSKTLSHVSSELRKQVRAKHNYRCKRCDIQETVFLILDVHHIIPRSCGGTNEISNLTALCGTCHKVVHRMLDAGLTPKF